MYQIAIKMLIGDRAKYLGLVFGITFATLLMSQQVSIFLSIMARSISVIKDVPEAQIWVMDPQSEYIDESKCMPGKMLYIVRGVEGVKWAVPFFKGFAIMRAQEGRMRQVVVLGVDDATLIGRPPKMLIGDWMSLREPDAIIIDKVGYELIFPGQPIELNKKIEINEQRVVIKGVCDARAPFVTFPILYTRYTEAVKLSPGERNRLCYILVQAEPSITPDELAINISKKTGLKALTAEQFSWATIYYYMKNTGIAVNFGITVLLGFIVGIGIAGQTFYIFIIENLKQFGALKAIGVTNKQIFQMVALQASLITFVGFGIGIGLCAIFFSFTGSINAMKNFALRWEVVLGTFIAIIIIVSVSSFFSLRRVLKLDPASVFR